MDMSEELYSVKFNIKILTSITTNSPLLSPAKTLFVSSRSHRTTAKSVTQSCTDNSQRICLDHSAKSGREGLNASQPVVTDVSSWIS